MGNPTAPTIPTIAVDIVLLMAGMIHRQGLYEIVQP